MGAEDAVDDDGAEFVADGVLLLAGGRDEELDVSAPVVIEGVKICICTWFSM
jgi:hypothetical protein